MGLFAPKCPLTPDEWEWQLACFKWLLNEFGGLEEHGISTLVLPSADHFPPTAAKGHAFAEEILGHIKQHSRMADWPTHLIAGEATKASSLHAGTYLVHDRHANLGEFRLRDAGGGQYIAQIDYNPDLIDRPSALIATLAHEMAHYLLSGAKTCPPGGRDVEEHATDLATVYMGFGIFLANDARNFSGFQDFEQQGWSNMAQGYLSEKALVTALAISETLAGRDPMAAAPHLKPYLAKDLKNAVKYCNSRDLSADVMAINLSEFGVN